LMSPWCPGFALPDCSSGYASDLRLWILEQEKRGRSREDVKAEILTRYGDKMLQAPRAEGRGVLAYAIPAALILLGGAVLFAFLRKQGSSASGALDPRPGAGDPQLAARIDAEFAAYDNTKAAE
jgi:cytochrome c-type biogenesis protein CcmH